MYESFEKWMKSMGYARTGIVDDEYVMMDIGSTQTPYGISAISLVGWKLKYLLFIGKKIEIDWSKDICDIIEKIDKAVEGKE